MFMANTLRRPTPDAHALLLGIGRPAAAKANAKILGTAMMQALGRCITQAYGSLGWTQKEAAAKVGVEAPELSKWETGERRAHFDRLFAVPELHQPLVVALAKLNPKTRVESAIKFDGEASS